MNKAVSSNKFTASFTIKNQVMKNFKFTGANIAAALLILAYFFPWVSILGGGMSGFKLTTTGISPGMLSMMFSGITRLLMVLVILVPVCGVIILYQNVTGNKKFDKYFKSAHIVPALFLIIGLAVLYFKMQPDTPEFAATDGFGEEYARASSRMMRDLSPGLFDILSIGMYISLAAGIYLLLVAMGKVKDKEYYKPAEAPVKQENQNNEPPVA